MKYKTQIISAFMILAMLLAGCKNPASSSGINSVEESASSMATATSADSATTTSDTTKIVKLGEVNDADWQTNIYIPGEYCIYECSLDYAQSHEFFDNYKQVGNELKFGPDSYLTLKDGWIYFSVSTGIYKVRTDGTVLTKLTTMTARDKMEVEDDWIVFDYCDTTKNTQTLYAMKIDGSQVHMLVQMGTGYSFADANGRRNSFVLHNNTVYFSSNLKDKDLELFSINIDGTGLEDLGKTIVNLAISDGSLIYGNLGTENQITGVYAMDLVTKKVTKADFDFASTMASDASHFVFAGSKGKIYIADSFGKNVRMIDDYKTIAGEAPEDINQNVPDFIAIKNDRIYCLDEEFSTTTDGQWYSVKLDGTDKRQLKILEHCLTFDIETRGN